MGYAFLGVATPIWVLLVLTFIQGTGMANVVPPTTESIMSSLPPERAGVGSAVGNVIWFVLAGWWLALGHLAAAVAQFITIIGIPLGIANIKLVPVSLFPLGHEVRSTA